VEEEEKKEKRVLSLPLTWMGGEQKKGGPRPSIETGKEGGKKFPLQILGGGRSKKGGEKRTSCSLKTKSKEEEEEGGRGGTPTVYPYLCPLPSSLQLCYGERNGRKGKRKEEGSFAQYGLATEKTKEIP